MKFEQLLAFRSDLYFEGAVQADWFYLPERSKKVAESFVFHGPSNHAVSADQGGYGSLIDTASFTQLIAEKLNGSEESNPFTLAIAGYGTGKSHFAVALSELLSGPDFHPDIFSSVLHNIARADKSTGKSLPDSLKQKNLVLTINGMNDFDLHYELLRTAQKALRLYGEPDDVIRMLDQTHETAALFVGKNYSLLKEAFEEAAKLHGIGFSGDELRKYLTGNVTDDDCFATVNDVYRNINGHNIRWDEGISAKQVLQTILRECCGDFGRFDKIVILFDEFGRFLEYASANPGKAGDSALQQIFEAVQNAEGDIQFVGFIQADIKAYLQRVDKASNISRYIDRFDASEKYYLSSNLETIFSSLIEPQNQEQYEKLILAPIDKLSSRIDALQDDMSRWLQLYGVWQDKKTFKEKIVKNLYPLHPLSTYLLTSLTGWLQSRSSLTLLSERFKELSGLDIMPGKTLPLLTPVELLRGNFFLELLNAEEQGRQRSQICILYNAICMRYSDKLTDNELAVLTANVILRICHFRTSDRADTLKAIGACTLLSNAEISDALNILENEYAVLEYDARSNCFDFIADAVGASEFRRYIRQKSREIKFVPTMLERNEAIHSFANTDEQLETTFGESRGIQTYEWSFTQHLTTVEQLTPSLFELYVSRWKKAITTDEPKGTLIWAYYDRNTSQEALNSVMQSVKEHCQGKPIVVFALNDAEGKLSECIVNYLAFAQTDGASKKRYVRFYEDGLKKAATALEGQFETLKRERLMFTPDGITPVGQRMGRYLTSVFEEIYPNAIPFDFENFVKKTATKGKKLFCSIAKMLVSGEAEQVLRVQGGELKSRFDSLLRIGAFSWKAVNQEYAVVPPQEPSANIVYRELEEGLTEKNVIAFSEVLDKYTMPPYGMNQYSVVLILLILSISESYHSRLLMDGQNYNCASWSALIFGDAKVEMKSFLATSLQLVDVAAASQKYLALFQRIQDNANIEYAKKLASELADLTKQEELPRDLEPQYKLAMIKNNAAHSAFVNIDSQIAEAQTMYYKSVERGDVQGCIIAYQNALHTPTDVTVSGFSFTLDDKQKKSLNEITEQAKAYIDAHLSEWLRAQRCQSVYDVDKYERRMKRLIKSLAELDYQSESKVARSILERELLNTTRIQQRADDLRSLDEFLKRTTRVMDSSSISTIEEYQTLGNALIKKISEYQPEEFNASQKNTISKAKDEVRRLTKILQSRKQEMNEIWDALCEVESIADLRTLGTRITALLNSGVTAHDREDFESLNGLINSFCEDVEAFSRLPDDRALLHGEISRLSSIYSQDGQDVDLQPLLDKIYEARLCRLDSLDAGWRGIHLNSNLNSMSVDQLANWKRETSQLPKYLKPETIQDAQSMIASSDKLLSEKRVAYIISLFNELHDDERVKFIEYIQNNRK